MTEYRLIDCGDQKKLEQVGEYLIIRPCPQAMWPKTLDAEWTKAVSEFQRGEGEKGTWKNLNPNPELKRKNAGPGIPENWTVESQDGLKWQVEPNQFGNIGIFTEHWIYAPSLPSFFNKKDKILNLFSYTGSNAMGLIKAGFEVTAVDSSSAAMDSYTMNLGLNALSRNGQRLILEDAQKFMQKEEKRAAKYGGIIIDAPSYGRGTKGEVFKIEENLIKLLELSKQILLPNGKIILTLHSPRFTPTILKVMIQKLFPNKTVETSEIIQECQSKIPLPSGFLVKIY